MSALVWLECSVGRCQRDLLVGKPRRLSRPGRRLPRANHRREEE